MTARCHLFFTVTDRSGNAIQNAAVNAYTAGTTNPVSGAMHDAKTGGNVITNPLISNSKGEVSAWLDTAQSVDLLITDNAHQAYAASDSSRRLIWTSYTEFTEVNPSPEDMTAPGVSFSGTPVSIGTANATGSSPSAARVDHVHAGEGLPQSLTGATTATRYVGGTTTGPPASGTFALGDFVVDQVGDMWICTTAGTPGTWSLSGRTIQQLGANVPDRHALNFGSGMTLADDSVNDRTTISFDIGSVTPSAVASAGATGTSAQVARNDHVHPHGSGYDPNDHHNQSHPDSDHSGSNKVELQVGGTKVGAGGVWRTILNIICSSGWVASAVDTGSRYDITIAGVPEVINLVSNSGNAFTNLAAGNATTEFSAGANEYRLKVDLTNARYVRIGAHQVVAAASGSKLAIQFSTDEATWKYCDAVADGSAPNAGTYVAMSTSANATLTSSGGAGPNGWAALDASLQGDVFIRAVGLSGDGVADPSFRVISLQAR